MSLEGKKVQKKMTYSDVVINDMRKERKFQSRVS